MNKTEKLESRADTMMTKYIKGHYHVLIERQRDPQFHPDPNYRHTGMALVGLLNKGQSLESFKKDWLSRKLKN